MAPYEETLLLQGTAKRHAFLLESLRRRRVLALLALEVLSREAIAERDTKLQEQINQLARILS